MERPQTSLSSYTTNSEGFSILDSPQLTEFAKTVVISHMSLSLPCNFSNLDGYAQYIVNNCFQKFKDKQARILPKCLAEETVELLESTGFLHSHNREFITDEENLGWPNIYWRIVRAHQVSDVGPPHADKWFWDLGGYQLPRGYRRTKIWVPLLQDDEDPSLMLLPGSQTNTYDYDFYVDNLGKRKPIFRSDRINSVLTPAPVRTGQAVVFHDNLIHGGRPTGALRVSIEWTLAHL